MTLRRISPEAGIARLLGEPAAADTPDKPAVVAASEAPVTAAKPEPDAKSTEADTGQSGDGTSHEPADHDGQDNSENPEAGDGNGGGADPADDDAGDDDTATGADGKGKGETGDDDGASAADDTELDRRPAWVTNPDGTRRKVSVGELKQGYLRQQDYTQKTMALAQLSKSYEDLGPVRQRYLDVIKTLDDGILVPDMPDKALADDNLSEYVKQSDAHREALARKQALAEERKRVEKEAAAENATRLAMMRRQSAEVLLRAVPQWSDPKAYEADRIDMLKTATQFGFSPEEAAAFIDPRMIFMVYRLTELNRAIAKGQQRLNGNNGAGKPAAAPTVQPGNGHAVNAPRPGRRVSQPSATQKRIETARQTLAQRRDVSSAVDFILARSAR